MIKLKHFCEFLKRFVPFKHKGKPNPNSDTNSKKAESSFTPFRTNSRISDIMIEMHNYSFYHSPLEQGVPDERFIGRSRIFNKFKLVIERNKTNSGAYLITGYRGMGKSSFVKRLVSSIVYDNEADRINVCYCSSCAIYLSLLLIFYVMKRFVLRNFLHINQFDFAFIASTICVVMFLAFNIFVEYKKNGYIADLKLSHKRPKKVTRAIRFVSDLLERKVVIEKRSIFISASLAMMSAIYLAIFVAGKCTLGCSEGGIFFIKSISFMLLGYLCIRIVYFVHKIEQQFMKLKTESPSEIWYNLLFNTFKTFKSKKFDTIELSLGYEALNEKDIFATITSQLRNKISEFTHNKAINFNRFAIVSVLALVFFASPASLALKEHIRNDSFIQKYIPSLYYPSHNKFVDVYKKDLNSFYHIFRKNRQSVAIMQTNLVKVETGDFNVKACAKSPTAINNNSVILNHPSFVTKFTNKIVLLNAETNIYIGALLRYYAFRAGLKDPYNGVYFLIMFSLFHLVYLCYIRLYLRYIKTKDKLYSRIITLEQRIYASLTSSKGGTQIGTPSISIPLFSTRRSSVQYPIASTKDIEVELLHILRMANLRSVQGKLPQFIIIIDEVDKIEPHDSAILSALIEETKLNKDAMISESVADQSRKRQKAVFALLSNLKHFFTTADTMFFFIAGQELFDASLADISDRNYFLGSIFHRVINIESFYSDLSDKQNTDITSMTENYLCRMLIPYWYIRQRVRLNKSKNAGDEISKYYTLEAYHQFLVKYFFPTTCKSRQLFSNNKDQPKGKGEEGKPDNEAVKNELSKEAVAALFTTIKAHHFHPNEYPDKVGKQFDFTLIDDDCLNFISDKQNSNRTISQEFSPETIDGLLGKDKATLDKLKNTHQYKTYLKNKQKVEKIISFLMNYVVYLSYRSNGSPKKIVSLLEDDLVSYEDMISYDRGLEKECVGFSSHNVYLHAGFNKQYNVNFLNYLVSPLVFSINASIKDYGDKLLVGSSFIYDHILKYHKTGFSMSDLDLMPEFIDINRAPEMRNMIKRIINTLMENHIEEVHSGLFDFSFNRKLVEEIDYLSKILDREAAAFNFTLDESICMKQYLYAKINYTTHQKDKLNNNTTHSVYASHLLISQLGDLHYYDDEFIDAILQYKNSIIQIRQISVQDMDFSQFINYIKTMLKIGLTYERMGNSDKALAYYEEASVEVIKYRNIDLAKFHMYEVEIKRYGSDDNEWKERYEKMLNILQTDRLEEKVALRRHLENIPINRSFRFIVYRESDHTDNKHPEVYEVQEPREGDRYIENSNNSIRFIVYRESDHTDNKHPEVYEVQEPREGDRYIENSNNFWHLMMRTEFSPHKSKLMAKGSMFENLQLFIQPLLAKLQVVERAYLGGIVFSDIIRTIREFKFVAKILRRKEEMYIQIEFYRRLANILFFKNSDFIQTIFESARDNSSSGGTKNPAGSAIPASIDHINLDLFKEYCDVELDHSSFKKHIIEHNRIKLPTDALILHVMNLNKMLNSVEKLSSTKTCSKKLISASTVFERVKDVAESLGNKAVDNGIYRSKNPVFWDSVAQCLSFLSDCLITIPEKDKLGDIKTLSTKFCPLDNKKNNDVESVDQNFRDAVLAVDDPSWFYLGLAGYVLSSHLYRKNGNYRGESFNYRKILYVLQWTKNSFSSQVDRFITEYLIKRSLHCITQTYSSVHRVEIQRYKKRMVNNAEYSTQRINLKNLNINADTQEYILSHENLKLIHLYRMLKRVLVVPIVVKHLLEESFKEKPTYHGITDKLSKLINDTSALKKLFSPKEYSPEFTVTVLITIISILEKIPPVEPFSYDDVFEENGKFVDKLRTAIDEKLMEAVRLCFSESKLSLEKLINRDSSNCSCYLIHNQVLRMINNSLSNRILYILIKTAQEFDCKSIIKLILDLSPDIEPQEKVGDDKIKTLQLLRPVITDGLFCMHQAIKLVNVNGITYKTNHSFYANMYYYMSQWCDELRTTLLKLDKPEMSKVKGTLLKAFDEGLRKVFGGDYAHLISAQYYKSKAQEHYKKAFDTHQGGDYYRQLISDMHYLHEDFGSDMYHFFAALDRMLLNDENTEKRYNQMKNLNDASTIYKAEYYKNL